jgi:glycosyltransferase involved in cell wall biosynthesis
MTTRVAFDMTPTIGTRTGIGNVVSHLYDAFVDQSVSITPYTLSYKARSFSDTLPANNVFINIPARLLLPMWKYTNFFSLDKQLGDVKVVHATNYLAPPTKKKLLITIHDLTMIKYPELVTPTVRALAPIIKRRLTQGAHVHVPAVAIKDDVLHYLGNDIEAEQIHVVPFAATELPEGKTSQRIESLIDGDPYVLSIGAIEPRKNLARLIASFQSVLAQHPHMRLFIVGPDGPARAEIDLQLAKLSHDARDRITITGRVSDNDRTLLLRHAAVVAYPSLYEGFGLPLLEAMTAGVPVVTTKEGSLTEVGGNAVHYVDPLDVDDIARGIVDVLDSADLRDRLITAGKSQVQKFSWENTAKELVAIYESM